MPAQLVPFARVEPAVPAVWHFPAGILGFPEVKAYRFLAAAPGPFRWLQAHEVPLAFVVVDPWLVVPDYHVALDASALHTLNAHAESTLTAVAIVTLPSQPADPPTVNLQGPLVLNLDTGLAMQLVLAHGPYHTRHPLVAPPVPAP
ncbi:MAG: flagellar assembly factor FliW [Candidatus Tectimicrobiota bacterium]|nr:MAG: flagellar assembly factor FliW [Candidatus Tectomicrobia bacterium]